MAFVINGIKWLLWTVKNICIKQNLLFRFETTPMCMRSTMSLGNTPSKHAVEPMLAHRLRRGQTSTGSTHHVFWAEFNIYSSAYCWRRVQADTDPMSVKCRTSVVGVGQYPFSPSQ